MRSFWALAASTACTSVGCGGKVPAKPPSTHWALHVDPIEDLAPAAGLTWLVSLKPREITTFDSLLPATHALVPTERSSALRDRYGVNPTELTELVIASYGATSLFLARGYIEPERVEARFTARVDPSEERGRAIDAGGAIVRLWGAVEGRRAQLAIFERDAAGLESGRFGPLRAAELFAEGRLHKASPALRGVPFARAAELAGAAPIRAFASGPFEGEAAHAVAGLLGASTALALAARPSVRSPSGPTPSTLVASSAQSPVESSSPSTGGPPASDPRGLLDVVVVLTGGWGNEAPAAAERLRAWVDRFGASPFGRLAGLDHPIGEPRVEALPDALRLTLTVDALAIARGINAATSAEIAEIMRE